MVFLERGSVHLGENRKTIATPWLLWALVVFFLAWDLWAVVVDQRLSSAESITMDTLGLMHMLEGGALDWREVFGPKGALVPMLALPLVWLLGSVPLATRLVAVAAHVVLTWQAHALGMRLGGTRRAGLWSALICASAPMVYGWARMDAQDLPLAVAVVAVVQVAAWVRLERLRQALVLGLVFGLGILVKTSILLYLVVPCGWLVLRCRRSPRGALHLLAALAVSAAVISPWLMANAQTFAGYVSEANQASFGVMEAVSHYLLLPGALPLLLAAAAGFVLLWTHQAVDRWLLVLLGATVATSLVLLCLLIEPWSRYALPVFPLAAVLAGAGVARLQERVAALARAPATWGVACVMLAAFTYLNLASDRGGPPRERRAGILRPDSRPHRGLPRALAALGTPARFLLVCQSGEAFSRFKGAEVVWHRRGLELEPLELKRGGRPGAELGVLVIQASSTAPLWNHDMVVDHVRDRHLKRARWLARQTKRLVVSTRDPDGLRYTIYRVIP